MDGSDMAYLRVGATAGGGVTLAGRPGGGRRGVLGRHCDYDSLIGLGRC